MAEEPKRRPSPTNTEQDPTNSPRQPESAWAKLLPWLVFGFLLWAVGSSLFQDSQNAEISYTEFKQQVAAGNVASIVMKGQEIRGEFVSEYQADTANGEKAYSSFLTRTPPVEDPELLQMLEQNDVSVSAEAAEQPWLFRLGILILPWVLILGLFAWANRRAQGQMKGFMDGGLFGFGKSRAKKFRTSRIPTTYDDVAGLENAKQDLREIVAYLKDPEKFAEIGADIPKGVLLMGPPGTGKTLLARGTAGEAGVPFYSISGSEFIEMFVGVGASRVRNMFETARKDAPAIVFIDEIDSVGRSRGAGLGGGHDEREQTLNQILSEMDGFEPHESVVVIAATNRPDILDPALTRPGRFDRQITLELPQKDAREKILAIHSKKVPVGPDVDLKNIAARTVGFSGADLHNLVNEAALLAGRKGKRQVQKEDFDEASDKIMLGAEREDTIDEDEKQMIAYHEAGHALVAKLLPNTDPLQKVTIIPRGRTLGATEQIPTIERHNFTRDYLIGRIAVALGGRAAERLVFRNMSNGAASDLKQVTQIARKMVCQWGMSRRLGPVTFSLGEDHVFLGREISQPKDYSEATARLIDEEIRSVLSETEEIALSLLRDNREFLDKLAQALVEQETLDNAKVDSIMTSNGHQPKTFTAEQLASFETEGEVVHEH